MKSTPLISFALRTAALLAVSLLAPIAGSASDPVLISKQDEGFLFKEADRKILFYQTANKSHNGSHTRCNYVHPLYDIEGNVLTEDFPADHLHHRGIFWAWHQVWVGDQKVGDPWAIQGFSWNVTDSSVTEHDDSSASLRVTVSWFGRENEKSAPLEVVREITTIRVHPVSQSNEAVAHRQIDFHIELHALVDGLRLGGSEDRKGYSGFSTRVKLPDDVVFTSDQGEVEPRIEAIPAGPWIDVSATFGGQPGKSGLAIFEHPSLPAYPQPWILRRKRSMQNAAYPGREAVPLDRETPWSLRYRLIVHQGDAASANLKRLHAAYAEESFSDQR